MSAHEHVWVVDRSTLGLSSAPMVACVCGEVRWVIEDG